MSAVPERILIIRLKSIGDVLLTLPAVHAVRENFPSARITFLTSKENAVLLQGFKDVDEILPLDRAGLRTGNPVKIVSEMVKLFQRLRTGKFSLVVDFQGYGETAWITYLTRARQRWGSLYSTGRKWAYTRGIPRNNDIQVADFYCSLLEQCGLKIGPLQNSFILPLEPLAGARDYFSKNRLDPRQPVLFIQALTSSPFKNWPLDHYLALAAHFRGKGVQILFGGGPKDVAALQPARTAGFVVATDVPLLVAAGLVQLSTVVIGGATGLLHIAVAMQKRVIMIVGKNRKETGLPFQHLDWVLRPDDSNDLATLPLETVLAACTDALAGTAPENSPRS